MLIEQEVSKLRPDFEQFVDSKRSYYDYVLFMANKGNSDLHS